MIKLPLLFVGSKGRRTLYTLFDSDADLSYIHPDLVKDIGVPVRLGVIRELTSVSEGHNIKVTKGIGVDFYIHNVLLSDEFFLVPSLSEEAIIGAPTLRKWRIKLDFEHEDVVVDPKVANLRL